MGTPCIGICRAFSEYWGAEEPQAFLTWGESENDSHSGKQAGIYYLVEVENKLMDTKGKRGCGMNWETGINIQALLILWIK